MTDLKTDLGLTLNDFEGDCVEPARRCVNARILACVRFEPWGPFLETPDDMLHKIIKIKI